MQLFKAFGIRTSSQSIERDGYAAPSFELLFVNIDCS